LSVVVLDAPVALVWAMHDEFSVYAKHVLQHLRSEKAIVPAIWPLEVMNGVLFAERGGRIHAAERIRFFELVEQLSIEIVEVSLKTSYESVYPLAIEYRLATYDASYLWLTSVREAKLATLDEKMRRAAKAAHLPLFV
jgi:predicted nucleic acid-binding protein